MTPEQALKTATTNAADLLGMKSDLGRIAPGYYADMIAVIGDPLANVQAAIDKVESAMKGGALVLK